MPKKNNSTEQWEEKGEDYNIPAIHSNYQCNQEGPYGVLPGKDPPPASYCSMG